MDEMHDPPTQVEPRFPSDVAFTPAVKAAQTARGSRTAYAKVEQGRGWQTRLTPDVVEFIAGLDMFYLGTANAAGQPYIQYRGGPTGLLRVLDERTLAFADFGGNRQYITVGNLSENPRAFLFLIDYVHARRVKIWGAARVVENDQQLVQRLADPAYPGKVERAIVLTIDAWDANCHQHIHQRLPATDVAPVVERLQRRIKELESELAKRDRDKPTPG